MRLRSVIAGPVHNPAISQPIPCLFAELADASGILTNPVLRVAADFPCHPLHVFGALLDDEGQPAFRRPLTDVCAARAEAA